MTFYQMLAVFACTEFLLVAAIMYTELVNIGVQLKRIADDFEENNN